MTDDVDEAPILDRVEGLSEWAHGTLGVDYDGAAIIAAITALVVEVRALRHTIEDQRP